LTAWAGFNAPAIPPGEQENAMKLVIDKNQGIDDRGRAFGFIWDKEDGLARGLFFSWPDDRVRAVSPAELDAMVESLEPDTMDCNPETAEDWTSDVDMVEAESLLRRCVRVVE
jgi:hypothetical protein